MPKRYDNIYSKIIDIDNIKRAHQNAKKDKSFYTAVIKTEKNLDERCNEIKKILSNHQYKVSPYKTSIIQDKNKKRILYKLPYYPDRIIQWAIMLQLEPIFNKVFTNFTCASIKGRGIHKASEMLDNWLNIYPNETIYCLKLDIKKFYPSIDRQILCQLLRKKIKDNDLLIELDKIINSMDNCDISNLNIDEEEKYWYTRPGKGLPIGSYLSQYLANYYLSFFDHWLKEKLHCKFVIRYMDDIIILGNDKEVLHDILNKIIEYLKINLKLEVKSNYQIFPVDSRGVDFVGYRHFRGYKLIRKNTLKNCKKIGIKMLDNTKNKIIPTEKEWNQWVSYIGQLQWCDSYNFYNKYYKNSIPIVNSYYWLNKMSKYKRSSYQFILNSKLKYKKKYYNNFQHKQIHKRRNDK